MTRPRYSDIQISLRPDDEEKVMATKKAAKKEPFGGKQAKPFGKKGEEDKDDKKPAKKATAKKK